VSVRACVCVPGLTSLRTSAVESTPTRNRLQCARRVALNLETCVFLKKTTSQNLDSSVVCRQFSDLSPSRRPQSAGSANSPCCSATVAPARRRVRRPPIGAPVRWPIAAAKGVSAGSGYSRGFDRPQAPIKQPHPTPHGHPTFPPAHSTMACAAHVSHSDVGASRGYTCAAPSATWGRSTSDAKGCLQRLRRRRRRRRKRRRSLQTGMDSVRS
jgi:hypothetical protein